jgi:glycosyltransferase involved in cell wall biosynthesis
MQGHLHTPQSWWIHNIERELATNAARIITVSRYMAQQAHDVLNVAPSMIDVIYNGVTLPCAATPRPAPDNEQRRAVRRRYAADHEALICFVGRLVHEKGAHTLLAALPRIRERVPHAKLVIAGTGPEADHLRHQAAASGMADHVRFAGYISDDARNELYGVADVAVFPSLYEPFGIVALEAMSFGCPVVVSTAGGLAEIVESHETGITTEPGNSDSLAWGVLHTLEHPDWAAARATNALQALQTTYSWQRIAAQTLDTYRCVMAAWHDGAGDHDTASADERLPVRHSAPTTQRANLVARS